MRLLMAVSRDGFLCRGPDDDMSWTGTTDKKVFRLLTGVGGVCAVGRVTRERTPRLELAGRKLLTLSRYHPDMHTLGWFASEHPDGWLLGGPTVAKRALDYNIVDEYHRCVIDDVDLGGGVPETDVIRVGLGSAPVMLTRLDNVAVEVYRLGARG